MKYGKIRDKAGIIPWATWGSLPHLLHLIDSLNKHQFIIILKAKQIGITWLMAGANLHLALFQQGANILTLSKGEDEATESLDYSRFMHSQLPDFLRLPLGKNQSSLLTFPAMHSKIRALPSTEDAGVGFGGASRVVMDEFEYHDYDEKNFGEIYPAVERGGQFVILSTADNTKIDTKFKQLYIAAKAGDNRFFKIFFPRNVLPERTQEWYDALDMPPWQKECRFPLTENDALTILKSRKFFDPLAIEEMYARMLPPIKHDLSDKYRGLVIIYRLPAVGVKYCLFTDPSDGKDDPHALIVIDAVTGEQVAQSHGKVPADEVAQIHDELVRLYNNAFNSYEINATAGGHFDSKIKMLETPNQCHRLKTDGRLDDKLWGWWTGKAIKDRAVRRLEEAIRLRQIVSHSKECLDEFSQFMQPEGEEPQKPRGGHDDYIDAWGRVLLLRNYIPMGEMRVISLRYG